MPAQAGQRFDIEALFPRPGTAEIVDNWDVVWL
jgi:hypothetical protein